MKRRFIRSYQKRNLGLAVVALLALVVPFLLMQKSSAQRPNLNQNRESLKAAPQTSYRSPGDRHKVQVSDTEAARSIEAQGGRLVGDYGAFKVYETNSAALQSLSGDAQVRDEDNVIQLNAGALDTTRSEVMAMRGTTASSAGKGMHLIQFAGPVKPEWYKGLLKTGAEVVTYIPSNAYLVYGDAKSLQAVRNLSANSGFVQWDGEYKSQYRIHPSIAASASDKGKEAVPALQANRGVTYQIQLVKDAVQNAATLRALTKEQFEPIKSQFEILNYVNIVVTLRTEESAGRLSKFGDVVSINPWVAPTKQDERQNQIMAGNLTGNAPTPGDYLVYLASHGFSFGTASTFGVNVSDSGLDNATTTPNHFGLYLLGNPTVPANSRVVYNRLEGTPNGGSTLQGCDGHGTLNTHIVGGYVPTGGIFAAFPHADASGFRYGLGVAPFVKFGSSVIFDPNSFTFPNFANLESKAYNDGMRISTNSWGASVGGAYTADAQAYDALVRDAQPAGSTFPTAGNQEHIIIFSAGNDGPGGNSVGTPGTAKNVITVGASENVQAFGGSDGCGVPDSGADNANDIIGFSSRGPLDDGRVKPDLVGPGTHVSGGVAQQSIASPTGSGTGDDLACFTAGGVCGGLGGNNFFPLAQQWYTASSGTSHSTPAVAGYAALIRQFFINNSLAVPSPAMTKVLMMNTARYLNGVGANDTLPSNNQGMGEPNLNSFFDVFVTPHIRHDQEAADKFTASGQQRVITGVVNSAAKPFRVTLAWTDVPGPTAGNAFVNNLDLEVTVGGNTFKGNVFTGANSTTGGSADIRNNVESVFIPAGVSGTFVVKVKGTNIAGNGVPGDADPLDQDYALLIYNAEETLTPVIGAGPSAITAESCQPPNNALDPGETVTVNFTLENIGTDATTSLVATLQATGGVTSPSGPQNYGAIPPGGNATRPFTFTVDPSKACGDTVTVTLALNDNGNDLGTVTFTFSVGALGAPITASYSSGNIAVPIPDVDTVDVPISVPDTGVVNDINVRFRANHTFDGDLVISLVHPDGTVIPLVINRGGSGDNFGTGSNDCSGTPTVLDDEAGPTIASGVAPFAGSFKPDSPLSGMDGKPTAGTWKLRFADTAAQDVGTIGCVTLEINRLRFICCGVAGTPNIVAGPAVLIDESCPPANTAIDPGERVSVNLSLSNTGTGSTTNLVATLQSGGGVNAPSAPQSYGALSPTGPGSTATRDFSFTASGSCGGTVTATWQLQDGPTNLGTVVKTFQLGASVNTVSTFSNPASILIPAGAPGTTSGPAAPYPSTINVAGLTGTVTKVTATLKNMNHTFPDDIDVLLVGPGGQKLLLMSDAGGSADLVNNTYTFDDAAAGTLADGALNASGTYKPSNFDTTTDALPAPAPAGPHPDPQLLSVFNGVNPNGTWSLYINDDVGGDVGNVNLGWELNITTTTVVCTNPCGMVRLVLTSTLTCVNPTTVKATYRIENTGTAAANSVSLTAAQLGAVTGTPLPQAVGNIPAFGASSFFDVFFSPAPAPGNSTLLLGGTYTGGNFSSSKRVTVPTCNAAAPVMGRRN